MMTYEADYIRGALEERKRIKKEILNLTMATSGTVFFADVMDIVEGRELKNDSKKRK